MGRRGQKERVRKDGEERAEGFGRRGQKDLGGEGRAGGMGEDGRMAEGMGRRGRGRNGHTNRLRYF